MQGRETRCARFIHYCWLSHRRGDRGYPAWVGKWWCWYCNLFLPLHTFFFSRLHKAVHYCFDLLTPSLIQLDIIELGVPFTDPIADGPTIQTANTKALQNGVTVTTVLDIVRTVRSKGLQTPLLLMGYYNPMMRYGEERLLKDCKEAGVNGFIMVDLPPEEAVRFRNICTSHG